MHTGKSLRRLLTDYIELPKAWERQVAGLCQDSRRVVPGDLFIAKVGLQLDAAEFIEQAIANGAVAVLRHKQATVEDAVLQDDTPVIAIANLNDYLGDIAARFYDYPSRQLQVIGITGTNGKTSICQLLAGAMTALSDPCGIIGTLGHGKPGQLQSDGFTTPDALALQALLAQFRDQDSHMVAMEVSSHALSQGRVNTVEYQTAVFTNLSRDHLDFHGDMQNYALAKKRLFLWPSLANAVINIDDPFGYELLHSLGASVKRYVYTLDKNKAGSFASYCLYVDNLQLSLQGIEAEVVTPWGLGRLQSPLLGRFNVSNLLAVLAVLGAAQVPLSAALDYLATVKAPAGRLQQISLPQQAMAVIDFAHTPDALQQALHVLREVSQGRVLCVFGCGGDRDVGKRALMGEIAEALADHVIVTNDNPRTEDPQTISQHIFSGMQQPQKAQCILDRRQAIRAALDDAKAGDIVLIAGKGHEDYQIIGQDKKPFSDLKTVEAFIASQPGVRS